MRPSQPAWERLRDEWGLLYEPLPDRTGPYVALLARRELLNPAEDGYDAAKLARDHAARIAYWGERLGPAPHDQGAGPRSPAGGRSLERLMVVGGSLAALGLIAVAWRTSLPVAVLGAIGLGATVAALVMATRRAGRPGLGEALASGLCPDCAYDLAGLPPALPPWVLAGADVGPESCPECGSPWPRVPPPVPPRAKDPTNV